MGPLILLCLAVLVYFLPSIVAANRENRNCSAIFAVNLLLGWTLIGWVVALVWALINEPQGITQEQTIKPDIVSKLKDLETMLQSGTITQQEFATLKAKLMKTF